MCQKQVTISVSPGTRVPMRISNRSHTGTERYLRTQVGPEFLFTPGVGIPTQVPGYLYLCRNIPAHRNSYLGYPGTRVPWVPGIGIPTVYPGCWYPGTRVPDQRAGTL
eukprot:988504-Rhodomonas_salina.1